jgi:hypothetical protein
LLAAPKFDSESTLAPNCSSSFASSINWNKKFQRFCYSKHHMTWIDPSIMNGKFREKKGEETKLL